MPVAWVVSAIYKQAVYGLYIKFGNVGGPEIIIIEWGQSFGLLIQDPRWGKKMELTSSKSIVSRLITGYQQNL